MNNFLSNFCASPGLESVIFERRRSVGNTGCIGYSNQYRAANETDAEQYAAAYRGT
jgi:hypothetical protein